MAVTPLRFDDWTHHPAAFKFAELERAAEAASVPVGGLVIDPFVGSGRAGTFVTGRGDRFLGIETHALMSDLARTKLSRPGSPSELRSAVEELIALAAAREQTVDVAAEQELLRRFLPHQPLRSLVALREAVDVVGGVWEPHLRWLVLTALRETAGKSWPYSRRAPDSRLGRPPEQVVWERLGLMTADLAAAPRTPVGRIITADARSEGAWATIPPASVDACISSPPYVNQVSFAEMTRLELHFLGWARSWREMNDFGRDMVASCTQQVSATRAHAAAAALSAHSVTDSLVQSLARRMTREQQKRPRGKRYDRLLIAYYADMAAVLGHLYVALVPGARAAWVVGSSAPYGVRVDTPYLLSVLAEELGFEVLEDVHLCDRGNKWTGVGARHRELLSERLIVFRRRGWCDQEALPGMEPFVAA